MKKSMRDPRAGTKVFAAISVAMIASACIAAFNARAAESESRAESVYVAQLHPMNSKITGLQAAGEARLALSGDTLTITIKAEGVPPDLVHWQHFHGFADNRAAMCPTSKADANSDGIIDLIETEPAAGTTMVPFTDDPASMDVAHGTYPKASAAGTYTYRQTVPLKELRAAFAKAFKGQALDLDRRVVFIHGVLPTSTLPASVASLDPVPADITLPIACGKIERVDRQ
jgi:hypothetical protein